MGHFMPVVLKSIVIRSVLLDWVIPGNESDAMHIYSSGDWVILLDVLTCTGLIPGLSPGMPLGEGWFVIDIDQLSL